MNDREVLQALLDGKTIIDESVPWFEFHYKLIGDRVYIRVEDHMWGSSDCIPRLDSDRVRILEEE